MKHCLSFVFLLLLAAPLPAAVHHKSVPAGTTKAKKKLSARYGSPRKVTKKTSYTRRSKLHAPPAFATREPARQLAPSNERYREIQEALAAKGYLAAPPTGQWDQDSQDAMRRFQADQKLDSNGKLTARSIIALGLGSSTAAVPPTNSAPSSK